MGSVMPTTPALDAEYAACPIYYVRKKWTSIIYFVKKRLNQRYWRVPMRDKLKLFEEKWSEMKKKKTCTYHILSNNLTDRLNSFLVV